MKLQPFKTVNKNHLERGKQSNQVKIVEAEGDSSSIAKSAVLLEHISVQD